MKTSFLVKLTLVKHNDNWYYEIQVENKKLDTLYSVESYAGVGLRAMIQDAIKQHALHIQYSPLAVLVDTIQVDERVSVGHMQHVVPEHWEADRVAKAKALAIPFI